jgi:hypothetical protein
MLPGIIAQRQKGTDPMTTYNGTFTVLNNTGGPINNVVVSHTTSEFGTTSFRAPTLGNLTMGAPVGLTTSTSNTDQWTVSFQNSTGASFTGEENCGFESEDNGRDVVVILGILSYSIIMPVSSCCTRNSYDQT